MNTYGGVSALYGGERSASRPGCFTLKETAPDIHYIGGWAAKGLSGLCGEEKTLLSLPGIESQLLGRPGRSLVAATTDRTVRDTLHNDGKETISDNIMVFITQNSDSQFRPSWPHASSSNFSCDGKVF
jgi:hypothetical protein